MLASPHPAARPQTQFRIRPVRSAADLEATVRLFNAYASAPTLKDCLNGVETRGDKVL